MVLLRNQNLSNPKTVFFGDTDGNAGPANVNKQIVESWPNDITSISAGKSIGKLFSILKGCLTSSVAVSTGPSKWERMAKVCGLASVAIAHGYAPFENEINNHGLSRRDCEEFDRWLQTSDRIVVFSELQAVFLENHSPLSAEKIRVCPMPLPLIDNIKERHGSSDVPIIAVSGGTRPIKNNVTVVEAVKRLCESHFPCELRVYGRNTYGSGEFLQTDLPCGSIRYMGQVSQNDFLEQLSEVDVFVMASLHEPFGLSALDALCAGCSVILSSHCGVNEVLNLRGSDVLDDCMDSNELASKIALLIERGNAKRLFSSIAFESYKPEVSAREIWKVCCEAMQPERKGF